MYLINSCSISVIGIDLESPEVAKVIKDTIIAQLKRDIDYLELIGVIKPLNLNPKGDKIYEGFKASDHVKSMIEEKALNDKSSFVRRVADGFLSKF